MARSAAGVRLGPWNKGKLVGQKAPFKVNDIWAIRVRLAILVRTRDLALFDLGIDSKLRGCDLVNADVILLILATVTWHHVDPMHNCNDLHAQGCVRSLPRLNPSPQAANVIAPAARGAEVSTGSKPIRQQRALAE